MALYFNFSRHALVVCLRIVMAVVVACLLRVDATAQTAPPDPHKTSTPASPEKPAVPRTESDQPPSISLSPAVIQARGAEGQTLTQTLSLTNSTNNEFAFDLAAQDVVIKDGKRIFVTAGEIERGIAATAVFSQKSVIVKPHTSASVEVRLTIPPGPAVRAIVALFQGTNRLPTSSGSVGMTASLGTLITFNLSDKISLKPETVRVLPPSSSSNLKVSQWIANDGTEPVLPEGVLAVLDGSGALVGKAVFQPQRLLPGERLEFTAEYPDQLNPGSYKALCSFQYESKTLTSDAEFKVP